MKRVRIGAVVFGIISHAGLAAAQSPREEQIRTHQKLAEAHRQAAECLKTNATIDECNRHLRQACPAGKAEQCAGVDVSELEKHKATHQMGGVAGQGPLQRPGPEQSGLPNS